MDQEMIDKRWDLFDRYKFNYKKPGGGYDMGAIIGVWKLYGCELTPEEEATWNYRMAEAKRRRDAYKKSLKK